MNVVVPVDRVIEQEVIKMRPSIIGPIGRAIAEFLARREASYRARVEKRAQAIYEGRAPWLRVWSP